MKMRGVRAVCQGCHRLVKPEEYQWDRILFGRCRTHPMTPLLIFGASGQVVEGYVYPTMHQAPEAPKPRLAKAPRSRIQRPEPEDVVGVCPLCLRRARVRDGGYRVHYWCRVHPTQELVLIDRRRKVAWDGQGWYH